MTETDRLMAHGEALFSQGRSAAAKECFLAVVALNPRHIEALNNLGVLAYEEGNTEGATNYLLQALAAAPYDRDATLNLADLLRAQQQLPALAPLIRKHVRYNPRDREIRAILDEVQQLLRQDKGAGQGIREEGDSFFVLSAGQCGAATLAAVLGAAPNVRVVHQPESVLAQQMPACYWGEADRRGLFVEHRGALMAEVWRQGLIYGETTPALFCWADLLARDLTRAKFVILVRNPLDFARSCLFANFYQGNRNDPFLLQPAPADQGYDEWRQASQIEKVCRLWKEVYGLLFSLHQEIDRERSMILRLEDLRDDPAGVVTQLFAFLGLDVLPAGIVEMIRKYPQDAAGYGRFPAVADWSPELRDTVRRLCGELAGSYGYPLPGEERRPAASEKTPPEPAGTARSARMPARPQVTVGLLLYSGGKMLAESIESILGQDFGAFELIVSDHGRDPLVETVGRHYERLDPRVKYINSGDRQQYLGINNFARMIELSDAPYFMWGSYDDRIEKSFIRRCLETISRDESIALVYPRSRVYNQRGDYIGPGNDALQADGADPGDRFLHVIWELNMCNAFYGLFRRHYMRKTRALRMNAYAHDNLFLAEIALLGRIVQIDDVLFIRRLTRNYDLSIDDHHADVIAALEPPFLEAGLTLPFCRLTYAHCELVNHSTLPPERKEFLTAEIRRCFRHRWAVQLHHEIDRLLRLLTNGVFYRTWDGRGYQHDLRTATPHLFQFHLADLVKTIAEARYLFPEHEGLQAAYHRILSEQGTIPDRTVSPHQPDKEAAG